MIGNINSNKACGPDGIHGKVLKNCASSLAYPLSLLFKLSYNTGCVPAEWKLAHVVPVHKKGCKQNIENYRPISLTSLVMKTFERILKEELLLRTSHLLDSRQHGFLAHKSCTTNMVNFTDSIVLSTNEIPTMSTDVIYFDFSKAFESVAKSPRSRQAFIANVRCERFAANSARLPIHLGERFWANVVNAQIF